MNEINHLPNFPLLDNFNEAGVLAALMIKLNAFVSIAAAEKITTLDKITQYRERSKGNFPKPVSITSLGRRKAYRLNDLQKWLDDPENYKVRLTFK